MAHLDPNPHDDPIFSTFYWYFCFWKAKISSLDCNVIFLIYIHIYYIYLIVKNVGYPLVEERNFIFFLVSLTDVLPIVMSCFFSYQSLGKSCTCPRAAGSLITRWNGSCILSASSGLCFALSFWKDRQLLLTIINKMGFSQWRFNCVLRFFERLRHLHAKSLCV